MDIHKALNIIHGINKDNFSTAAKNEHGIILLECMSNLVANEMFRAGHVYNAAHCVGKIINDLKTLEKSVDEIVVVSNNVFEDGVDFDEGTKEYLRALGTINQEVSKLANEVYEVVVGIGVKVKEIGRAHV